MNLDSGPADRDGLAIGNEVAKDGILGPGLWLDDDTLCADGLDIVDSLPVPVGQLHESVHELEPGHGGHVNEVQDPVVQFAVGVGKDIVRQEGGVNDRDERVLSLDRGLLSALLLVGVGDPSVVRAVCGDDLDRCKYL